jgi:hypothetical protein
MHSLRGALDLLLGQTRLATALWILGMVVVGWMARRVWARQSSLDVRFAVLALTGLLWNPHLYVYDLVLLGVPLGCLASWAIQGSPTSRRAAGLAYALVWLPLIGPLAKLTHLQITAAVMVLLLVELSRTPATGGRAC